MTKQLQIFSAMVEWQSDTKSHMILPPKMHLLSAYQTNKSGLIKQTMLCMFTNQTSTQFAISFFIGRKQELFFSEAI
jgi:hypothetical protein